MEKIETPIPCPGTPTSATDMDAASVRQRDRLQIEARATRWWEAYGGASVSNR
jgi:hypothetical protein